MRIYGQTGTIHQTKQVDVELDREGVEYRLLTPSGVETPDSWNNISDIPEKAADRFERYFDTEEAEVIAIDKQGNRTNLGFLVDAKVKHNLQLEQKVDTEERNVERIDNLE